MRTETLLVIIVLSEYNRFFFWREVLEGVYENWEYIYNFELHWRNMATLNW